MRFLAGVACALLAFGGAVRAQTDEQTRELMERERRYYEQKARQAPQTAPAPEAPAADPEAERKQELERFIAEADRLIRDRNYASRSTPHYKVQTDDPRLDPAVAAGLLESFRAYFDGFWDGRVPLRPYEGQGRIFLFYSYFKYNQLLTGQPRFGPDRSTGHYRPQFDVVVLHTDPTDPAQLADALVHEAAHQLAANRIFGPGASPSLWLAEGLGDYFGYTLRLPSGEFVPGGVGPKGVDLMRDGPRGSEGAGRRLLREIRKEAKRSEGLGLAELVAVTDPNLFYGEGAEGRYARSWMLVHYLLHADGGRLAPAFASYLQEEAAGRGGPESFFRALGVGPAALEAGVREHILSLKENPAKRPEADG